MSTQYRAKASSSSSANKKSSSKPAKKTNNTVKYSSKVESGKSKNIAKSAKNNNTINNDANENSLSSANTNAKQTKNLNANIEEKNSTTRSVSPTLEQLAHEIALASVKLKQNYQQFVPTSPATFSAEETPTQVKDDDEKSQANLYQAWLSELSVEGVTRQLLQHASLSEEQLGEVKSLVRAKRAQHSIKKGIAQLALGGILLALGILPQIIFYPAGASYMSLYQLVQHSLTMHIDQSGVFPVLTIAFWQVFFIGGGATLATLGAFAQVQAEAWNLPEQIAKRV